MNNCYEFRKLNTGAGIFENVVDACVVITCCESNNYHREHSVYEKLKKHNIHSNTYILYNKGFKTCNKEPNVKHSAQDITHAVYTIFNKFIESDRLLVLEDDFEINEKYFSNKHINNIKKFIDKKYFDIYSLGSFSLFFNPLSMHHRCYDMYVAQANIYSKMYIKKFIDYFKNETTDFAVDYWYNSNPDNFLNYRYFLPLVCQKFPKTENMSNWDLSESEDFILSKYISILNFDNQIEPGFTIIYYVPLFFYILIILSIIIWLRR